MRIGAQMMSKERTWYAPACRNIWGTVGRGLTARMSPIAAMMFGMNDQSAGVTDCPRTPHARALTDALPQGL
eukprot:COSAG01_NODE_4736_length_4783_cov_24.168019_3_plen_72_part_00